MLFKNSLRESALLEEEKPEDFFCAQNNTPGKSRRWGTNWTFDKTLRRLTVTQILKNALNIHKLHLQRILYRRF